MQITMIGIDLAKAAFAAHGINAHGKVTLKGSPKRAHVVTFLANLEPPLLDMEAYGGAYYWARRLTALGRTMTLMAPQFVKPYAKANKIELADAEAICGAVSRPNMCFVPIETTESRAVVAPHRGRHVSRWLHNAVGRQYPFEICL